MGLFNLFKKKEAKLTDEQKSGIRCGICGQKTLQIRLMQS